ncbi:MAG: cell-cell cohesion protein MtsF, partial [Myxococcaceae bacterium]
MRHAVKVSLLGFALLLSACPTPEPVCEDDTDPACGYDAGQPPPDECNTREEALELSQCRVALEVAREAYISFAGDSDWYLVEMPGTLTARSLVHVSGGYAAPNTAVNLALGLLREDGSVSLARGVDHHGQAAPKPVELVVPFSEQNAKLLVLVQDENAAGKANFDAKQPYTFTVSVVENPDSNEPNDSTPTALTLAAQGAVLVGQQTGYLATADDVDRFTIVAPGGRKVLYLHLTAPRALPSANYRMSYTLLDAAQKPVAEGRMDNEFLAVDLATARLTTAGSYTLVLQGYRPSGVTGPIPGNMSL